MDKPRRAVEKVYKELEKSGSFYLLTVRLVLYLIHKQLKGAEPMDATLEDKQATQDLLHQEYWAEYDQRMEEMGE